MTNSPNAMPGAFNLHSTSRDVPPPPRLSGAKSHIFQPPRTPGASASSSLLLTRSTTSVVSLSSAGDRPARYGPRKRNLEEYNSGTVTPRNDGQSEYAGMEDTAEGWIPGSPQPFVNTRYQLAGGMDTPSLSAAQAVEANEYGDLGYRKSLGDTERPTMFTEGGSYFPGETAWHESNGRPRLSQGYSGSPRGDGWSKAALQVANVVVGKVWEFCKTSSAVFKGFQAGGGTRYRLNHTESDAQFEAVGHSVWEEKNGDRESTPLPGQYPTEELEYIPDYMDRATPESTPPRPTKRRQISANYTSAKNKDEYSMPTASSASRRAIANTSVHRPASRAGFGGSAPKRPLASHASRVSHAGSPALNNARGASYASPRSPQNPTSKIPRRTGSPIGHVRNGGGSLGAVDSPAAKEAKRWAALKRKEEREADESIRRLDAQLKAMIREGKEALGTKIEVEIDDDLDLGSGNSKKWAI
ncbi:uncharacterized protein PAC_08255 [Phialocephala subalpina]|uniref:Uncharacterized protein n=1 Tax=Phialocephala subalpina TaxID=576137 RepID=A0A1L7X015_9HELO|nr:uncharacterized protein PAC_08255 [Phialocephala subalpina]